ncbi:MAG: ABC transporter permease [Oscillospiraceae bacterium]
MNVIWDIISSPSFYYSILRVTTPILLAALAAFIADKAGLINMGLEGIMLSSALTGVVVSAATSNVWLGLLGAIVMGLIIGLIMAYSALNLKTDIILTGIAVNLMAGGGSIFFLYVFAGNKGNSTSLNSGTLPTIDIPLIENIPILGEIISGHNILTYFAFIMVFVMFVLISKTTLGLRIRSVGENDDAAASVGISKNKIRYLALAISGMLAGVAGAYMSMGYVSWFSQNMTAGRGFIALAAETMGASSPLATMVTSLIFGTAEAVSISIASLGLPPEMIQAIPYIVTLIGLVVNSVRKENKRKAIIREQKIAADNNS